ncbi:hypothetical protein E8E11_011452 [Didymella keratinophila]|nr:hypothetical protein E8E11_011452 [Didymella keratinophila]
MGPKKGKKNKEYYAVFSGRVAEPTIYSSWGDAHPRVTNCDADFAAFHSIKQARAYMTKKGAQRCKEVIKKTALETTPRRDQPGYYAVAYGTRTGITQFWQCLRGDGEALSMTNEAKGVCHKRFSSKEQAEAFIEDWKIAYADVLREEVKKALDRGLRPRDMEMDVSGLLQRSTGDDKAMNSIVQNFDVKVVVDRPINLEDDKKGLQ